MTRTRPVPSMNRRIAGEGNGAARRRRCAASGSTGSGAASYTRGLRSPGGECACRRPSPLRRLPARPLPGPRRCRPRRRRGRGRAALGRERRREDHVAAAPGRAACRSTRARPSVLGHDLAARPARRPPRPRARRPRDLLLRRPDRAREPRVRGARVADARSTRPTPRSSGSGSPRCADVAHRRLSAGQRAGSRSRSRWRATRGCCCSTSRTPGSTPRAARCSTTIVRSGAGRGPHGAARVARARARPSARRPRGRARRRTRRRARADAAAPTPIAAAVDGTDVELEVAP